MAYQSPKLQSLRDAAHTVVPECGCGVGAKTQAELQKIESKLGANWERRRPSTSTIWREPCRMSIRANSARWSVAYRVVCRVETDNDCSEYWARVAGVLNPWILPFGPIDLQVVEVKITAAFGNLRTARCAISSTNLEGDPDAFQIKGQRSRGPAFELKPGSRPRRHSV